MGENGSCLSPSAIFGSAEEKEDKNALYIIHSPYYQTYWTDMS